MKVDLALGHGVVQLVRAEVSGKTDPLVAAGQCFWQLVSVDAERIDIELGEARKQIGSGDSPASYRLVDHERQSRQAARIAQARVGNAVLDHAGRRTAAIPEHVVEMRHVY